MSDQKDVTVDEGWEEGDEAAAPPAEGGEGRTRPSDEERYEGDERARDALVFVTKVLDEMDMECEVELRRPKPEEPNEIQLEIFGRDAGRIIGKKGQVL